MYINILNLCVKLMLVKEVSSERNGQNSYEFWTGKLIAMYGRVLGPSKKNFFFQFLEILSQFLEILSQFLEILSQFLEILISIS